MKKIIIILFALSQVLIFCKPNKMVSQNKKEAILIAKINHNKIVFLKDTIDFKIKISEGVFSKKMNVQFDKINILKQNVVDRTKLHEELYYVIMYDFSNNLKTARVLKKIDNKLFFSKKGDFEQTYISCVGKESYCKPKIIYDDFKIVWVCGDELKECSLNSDKKCQVFHSVLF